MLKSCESALWDAYDLAILDLDGVVYVGADAVPGAVSGLARARAAGMRLAFVTNNAARTPDTVAAHLSELGVPAEPGDVVTSAQAAARLVRGHVPAGAAVFVIGGEGLVVALEEQGLRPTQSLADEPVAAVSGYHRDLAWGTVSDGAVLVGRGVPWVAANTDRSVPTPSGLGPGNGVLVEAVARFSGRTPEVAGKPLPPLFEETVRRVGGRHPLVVGDRLDTDIEGAVATGHDSLLVLTGVTGLAELVAAVPRMRPTYLAADLAALAFPQPAPETSPDGAPGGARCGGWSARVAEDRLVLEEEGTTEDWWRAAVVAAWRHLDTSGRPCVVEGVVAPSSVAP
ncbi:MAG: HAD-IIA family hydrolase [Nocardioides sp.]